MLTDFFRSMPMVQNLWLSCLVFEPDARRTGWFRDNLVLLWRVYTIMRPVWREQQRADEREKKEKERRRQRGINIVPLDEMTAEEDDTEAVSPVDRRQHRGWEEERDSDPERAVLNEIALRERIGKYEPIVAASNEEQQAIYRCIDEDPDITPAEIADKTGIPEERVYWQLQRLRDKLKKCFPPATDQ